MPEPSASHDRAGCRRRGAWSSRTAMVRTSRPSPTGQRRTFHQSSVRLRPAVVLDHRVAEGTAGDDHQEADADGHGEDRR